MKLMPLKGAKTTDLSLYGIILTLGVVFGDLGTSPLYTMQGILNATNKVDENFVLGALSCVFWTLTLQTTVKYVLIALRARNNGEGGILTLFTLVKKNRRWTYIIGILGACALLGDGVITPSITVTSAMEGVKIFAPSTHVVFFVLIILTVLFASQQFGIVSIAKYYGPIMVLWFAMIGVLGFIQLIEMPSILKALNPYYAYHIITAYPQALVLLGAVFLCTTGAEALYSDIGQCGYANIRYSWIYVKVSLLLSYFGQGVWALKHLALENAPGNVNPFFSIMPNWFLPIGVIISTMAAIIASQALITGSFSVVSEAISLKFFPKIRINYPTNIKGQMYIPLINWTLYLLCLFVVFYFQNSNAMQSAYGVSITIAMLMTSVLLTLYIKDRLSIYWAALYAVVYFTIEIVFFTANITKFFSGGWFTIALTMVFSSIMYTWFKGGIFTSKYLAYKSFSGFKDILVALSNDETVPKYASHLIYMSESESDGLVENKILYSILRKGPKRADTYWFVHVEIAEDDPHKLEYSIDAIEPGKLYRINMFLGYKVPTKVNFYFNKILDDMIASKEINMVSTYPSLKKYNVMTDLVFIMIEVEPERDYVLSFLKQIMVNYYFMIKRAIVNESKSYGLDPSHTHYEKVPFFHTSELKEDSIEEIQQLNELESGGEQDYQNMTLVRIK